MLLVALFASVRLFYAVTPDVGQGPPPGIDILGMNIPYSAVWAGGFFLVVALVAFVATFGVRTGLAGVDGSVQKLIDLLIDTQAELAKVSWPNRDQLTRSTTAVLISVVLIGLFLLGVDLLVGYVMRLLDVLPG